jgi:hypothetical protein
VKSTPRRKPLAGFAAVLEAAHIDPKNLRLVFIGKRGMRAYAALLKHFDCLDAVKGGKA